MAKEFNRSQRVAEQLQREIAVIIQTELKDPRVGFLTISGVDVSRDLAHAKIFFTILGENDGDEDARKQVRGVLNQSTGYLRHVLGQRLRLRAIPQLLFFYDDTAVRSAHLNALIDEAVAADHDKKTSDEE